MDPFTRRRVGQILDGYIQLKVPRQVRDSVRLTYKTEGNRLTLTEHRPSADRRGWSGTDIVQFRLDGKRWTVFTSTGPDEWSLVESIRPAEDFEQQLEQVELDHEGLFWNPDLSSEQV
ncbi:Protein of unknown function [Paenibacillus sp. UNCCL117]|uniref:DUF3024 domain-containing protein n=1 Tax=unclassified Paenibacillus TaxID=185978 RepID=UPI000888CEA2|nr:MULTISPECIES: DUF3024 domain-containing protein [unclassified Paenibacillus]SDD68478.1 Protein of unknown function [Paenibacillus sp. cl123]SFW44918.1 Protein of unknown function [Paenibacillus sp. UNCCL117]